MKPKEIQRLIALVEKSNIAELEVSRWGRKVRIRKYANNHQAEIGVQEKIVVASHPAASLSAAPSTATPSPEVPQVAALPPKADEKTYIEVRSPMVGTFYRAPAPEAAPYVEMGAVVIKGQVLCIIEAMKLMNEIESDAPGKIAEILVENAQPVEYNQLLFKMEKV